MKKTHQQVISEDLERIEKELGNKEHFLQRLPTSFQIIMGISIIILLLSLVIVTYPINDIIRGRLESTPLTKSTLVIDNYRILFNEGVLSQLQQIYIREQKVEFSVCLQGILEKGNQKEDIQTTYHITSLYQPRMYEQTFNHVTFESCTSETLVMLHSHPYKSCVASQTDLQTLQKTKERNNDTIMVVMCEPERFSVYRDGSKLSNI